ncbi:hypothetical protein DLJ46_22470 [Micromonospora globispora]|uniref:Heme oxygenase n=1 Tax=Micromonospora globispora TaxID=1450148 RepID=A0A317JWV4_9ACTN|nr:biliverdin-producing heme oxygenase [Micromonospora globispora]PWU45115.1 hypothetical protein DLJ46_22470 [Micromonospora globispora]RQW88928.1 hypothetical protein DKL51_24200 [Micromonospora globispora]
MPNQLRSGAPDPVGPMLAALRTGTRDHHLALERQLDLPGRIRSRADLVCVLSALLASWQPLERQLAAADWATLGIDAQLGAASDLLRADLEALPATEGGDPEGPFAGLGRQASGSPRFDTAAAAVGGRYVLLGSALGGRVIAPVVEKRLDLPAGTATRFFRRTGMEPGRDWRTFRSAVAGRDWSPEGLEHAASAARETFAFVGRTAGPILAERPPARRRVA